MPFLNFGVSVLYLGIKYMSYYRSCNINFNILYVIKYWYIILYVGFHKMLMGKEKRKNGKVR